MKDSDSKFLKQHHKMAMGHESVSSAHAGGGETVHQPGGGTYKKGGRAAHHHTANNHGSGHKGGRPGY